MSSRSNLWHRRRRRSRRPRFPRITAAARIRDGTSARLDTLLFTINILIVGDHLRLVLERVHCLEAIQVGLRLSARGKVNRVFKAEFKENLKRSLVDLKMQKDLLVSGWVVWNDTAAPWHSSLQETCHKWNSSDFALVESRVITWTSSLGC